MPIVLYQFSPIPPCIMIRLIAKQLDIEMDIREVNLNKGDHLREDFIQINPQHTIPTIVDDGLILTESRAILMYLVNKYGTDDQSLVLYPTDPNKRAVVDMRLCFDLATLYPRFMEAYVPVLLQKGPLDPDKIDSLDEALGYIDTFLKDSFIAGTELTIADFSIAVVLAVLDACGHNLSKFAEIPSYLEKCAEKIKGWQEVNVTGASKFGELFKAALDGSYPQEQE